ncbi:sn-glycerol-3-phosphate ABC transporter ATP-binding protein UgpC [Nitrosomonas sp. HPC101]|uniref:ABC transporter ATP-binding protein n=1 Tax=Nitrosomonas sp. HPC101 TaxID=1658667 RepID=UPI001367EF44|nr:sn-glycerol-3-phosphate ABC transporter ATP-binding protein UgpC [Nitrosomonas sp. HPC101]MXS86055.1 sn-glycerol-3-phosphate ABC transporter ATP-binding protein UgpC [Nitrosomonas sp. HPC101]
MAKIELRNVTKQFSDGTTAINAASLTIHDGEFFILVGPSGCGKSTLLHMIAGIETITSGEIRIDDVIANDIDPKDRNMAMVFQSYALYPHMSVRENIAFPLVMRKLPKPAIAKRVEETAALLELSNVLDSKPRDLSGGQRQRVAMGRAIVRNPVVFLLDEPLSNLDTRLRDQMRTEIARLQKQLHTTTIYVTHDQTEAMTLGDRIAVLKEGVIQQIGTPYELYEQPRNTFIAGFIGSPAMNFFPVQIRNNQLFIPLLNLEAELPQASRLNDWPDYVIAGIRPEHFNLLSDTADTAGQNKKQIIFDIPVEIVEWLGANLLVHFRMENHYWPPMPDLTSNPNLSKKQGNRLLDFTARLNTDRMIKEGNRIRLTVDPDKLYLFDPQTGNCLRNL